MDLESRHKAGIFALKVLEFREGNQVIVKHPLIKDTCILLPVPPDLGFQDVGVYVDVKISHTDEKRYKAEYQGISLPEFVPSDGREIN